jgi:hypothetical protein
MRSMCEERDKHKEINYFNIHHTDTEMEKERERQRERL